MNLYPQVKSTVGMLIVCVISGLLSGWLFTQGFQDALFIREGALVGPGLVFGLLFSITIAGAYIWRREHMLFEPIGFVFLFTIASTIIYFIAFQTGMWFMIFSLGYSSDDVPRGLTGLLGGGYAAGGLAGLLGAGALSIATKYISGSQITFRNHVLTSMIGAITGSMFFLLVRQGGSLDQTNWSPQFILWQVAVGLSLSRSIQISRAFSNKLHHVPDPQ